MPLKDIWIPQDTTMDASPDIPNMLADAIIQNESDIATAQSTADAANKTVATLSGQLADMNVAIQGHTGDILQTNVRISQAEERITQNETDIKTLQESGGGSLSSDELYSLAYYGDINIKPSDSNLFDFTTDDTTMTASIKAKSTNISGDIVIPYEYVKDSKVYSVTSIGSGAFHSCIELLSVIIPKGVTTIGYQSFPECLELASITIPDGVTTIDESAFTWDECLTSITLPASVTSIGKGAFLDCKNLTNIYFKGTKEQWDAINIGGTNNSLEKANIHYDWSEVTKEYVDDAVRSATPVKGVDYWTDEDKAEIYSYVEDAILGGAW